MPMKPLQSIDGCRFIELPAAAKAMAVLAQKPGIYGMIGGQVVDVERTGQPLEADVLNFIYTNKTSALIQCAMMIGAILAGAEQKAVAAVESAADKIGIAFQIQDDILDVPEARRLLESRWAAMKKMKRRPM